MSSISVYGMLRTFASDILESFPILFLWVHEVRPDLGQQVHALLDRGCCGVYCLEFREEFG